MALLGLGVSGCSTPTPLLSDTGALRAFEPISANPADTCGTQKAIARHNSRYDSIRLNKPVSYAAVCELKKVKPAAAEPKTS